MSQTEDQSMQSDEEPSENEDQVFQDARDEEIRDESDKEQVYTNSLQYTDDDDECDSDDDELDYYSNDDEEEEEENKEEKEDENDEENEDEENDEQQLKQVEEKDDEEDEETAHEKLVKELKNAQRKQKIAEKRFKTRGEKLLEEMGAVCGGRFTTCGELVDKHPGLEVKSEDSNSFIPIGLPISKPQAEEVLQYFSKAPFGLGQETKYDDTIRKTWQMEPDQFLIKNPNWDNSIQQLVQNEIRFGLDLGLNRIIKANLYKLLLYDEKSHFNFHKDTEKEPNMFGTLVIQLPSYFTGGNLIVKQEEEQVVYECEKNASFSCKYFCFYADCEHCVKPIESGYRMCLIYNLVFCDSKKVPKPSLNLFNDKIDSLISEWDTQPNCPVLYYILDHDYTKLGLKFDCLKGRDAHIYAQLQNYISSHPKKLSLYFGILTQTDYQEEDATERRMALESREYSISKCVNWKNEPKCKISNINPKCIIPQSRRNAYHNSDHDSSGPSGNEAATAETTYYTACFMLFPKKNKNYVKMNSCPLEYLDELRGKDTQAMTQFFEMIVQQVTLPCKEEELVNWIETHGNNSLANLLLKNQQIHFKNFKRLVKKFGAKELNFMEMKLTKYDDKLLKLIISLNDLEILSYCVNSFLSKVNYAATIVELVKIVESNNFKISNSCIPAMKIYLDDYEITFEQKLKIVTQLQNEEVTKAFMKKLLKWAPLSIEIVQCAKLLEIEQTIRLLKKEFSNYSNNVKLIPFICSVYKLEVPTDLETTKESILISLTEILNGLQDYSKIVTKNIEWQYIFELIANNKFSPNCLSKLVEEISNLNGNDYRHQEILQKLRDTFIELSKSKGNKYLQGNETIVAILKAVHKTMGTFSPLGEIVESIDKLEPPQKKLKQ